MRSATTDEKLVQASHPARCWGSVTRLAAVLILMLAGIISWLRIGPHRSSESATGVTDTVTNGSEAGWTRPPSSWQADVEPTGTLSKSPDGTPVSEFEAIAQWAIKLQTRSVDLYAEGDIDTKVLTGDLDRLEIHDPHRPFDRTVLQQVAVVDTPQWRERFSRGAFHGNMDAMRALHDYYGGEVLDYGGGGVMFPADSVQQVHTDRHGWSLLHDAVLGGDIETVQVLACGLFSPAQPTGVLFSYGQVAPSEFECHMSSYHLAALLGDIGLLRLLTPSAYERMQADRMLAFREDGNGPYSLHARYEQPDPRPAWQKWGSASQPWRFNTREVDWSALSPSRPHLPPEWREDSASPQRPLHVSGYPIATVPPDVSPDDGLWIAHDVAGLTVLDYAKVGGNAETIRFLESLGVHSVLPDGWDRSAKVQAVLQRIRQTLEQVQRP